MNADSIAIPAERVPPIAADQSGTSQAIAGVLLFVALVCAVAGIAAPGEPPPGNSDAYDAGYVTGTILGIFILAGLPAWFGFRSARNAVRAKRAVAVAKGEPSVTWSLAGKWVVAADGAGVPRLDLSFKISRKLRTMLLAVPRAQVRG